MKQYSPGTQASSQKHSINISSDYRAEKQIPYTVLFIKILDYLEIFTGVWYLHYLQQDYNIPMTKKLEGEVAEMCNLSEGIEQRGIQKGIQKGRLEGRLEGQLETRQESIQNLMKNLKLSMEQAMTALGIPETEWETYRKLNKTHN